eukprot:1031234-Pyramimonas_sp.AAC.1
MTRKGTFALAAARTMVRTSLVAELAEWSSSAMFFRGVGWSPWRFLRAAGAGTVSRALGTVEV